MRTQRGPAASSLSGFCTGVRFPRIAPATCANDVPLETVANRSVPMACGPNVDQACPLAGAAALRVADLGWQGRPPPAAPTSEPRLGDRLVRGSPGGVWARDIPLCRRAVPGQRHGGTPASYLFKPRVTTVLSWPTRHDCRRVRPLVLGVSWMLGGWEVEFEAASSGASAVEVPGVKGRQPAVSSYLL